MATGFSVPKILIIDNIESANAAPEITKLNFELIVLICTIQSPAIKFLAFLHERISFSVHSQAHAREVEPFSLGSSFA